MASTKQNRTISDFKGALIGGGARPNLFEVELTTLPAGIAWNSSNFSYMCKAATLPASNIANIDIPFRGRIFKVAGDRTIDPWTVTIINDENFDLRNAMEEWTDLIASLERNMGATDPEAYMVNAKVYQLGRGSTANSKSNSGTANSVLKEYEFFNIFPTSVAAIDLSYDSTDTIEEFTVDFQVQSYRFNGAGGSNG
jgi:CRISPR/Cas system-associated protein Cas10 (large subunit of type III CRISPR-Cas system)|tara:strand:- start:156 stop:746 length:591 start_codon:yes stop_codon:yes gene_type:complete